ncbi:MAG: hypothetical protein HY532_09280 [Chloroflexi bacterium]|nr:hypothetical protein [Chloroflexota bacterium]MBI4216060.1 hypothetical protein [Chloroflexota bacterium]
MPRFHDITAGTELPPLTCKIEYQHIMDMALCLHDHQPMHLDTLRAKEAGRPGPATHGPSNWAFFCRFLTDWLERPEQLVRIYTRFLAPLFAGDTITNHGRVKAKRQEGGQGIVEVELWQEKADGTRTMAGEATVALPLG